MKTVSKLPFGGTDCALPMLYAQAQEREVDTFVIYTDSETWAGSVHPAQALREYRQRMGISSKLVVVGMVSNGCYCVLRAKSLIREVAKIEK